jgi:hypothetical protein
LKKKPFYEILAAPEELPVEMERHSPMSIDGSLIGALGLKQAPVTPGPKKLAIGIRQVGGIGCVTTDCYAFGQRTLRPPGYRIEAHGRFGVPVTSIQAE